MKHYEIWEEINKILESDTTNELKEIQELLNRELKD